MVKTSLKKKAPQIVNALNGRIRPHHQKIIQMHFDHLEYIDEKIKELENEISKLVTPYQEEMNLLITIPGIKEDAAASILAELGIDMSKFPTEKHVSSWGGFSPGNNESAGKKKSAKSTKGNKGLKSVMCQVAWAAMKTKDRLSSSQTTRPLQSKHGASTLINEDHLPSAERKTPYKELGWDYLPTKERKKDYFIKKLMSTGYEIEIQESKPA
ncbi:IS110 family transposase [Bacillus sp. 2205SS5-2]|uniref:IS110 family transposase n=1 Tax=Bacillus sp. 2205SS5-2 TaxID=3109031 RepID=UPI00300505A5